MLPPGSPWLDAAEVFVPFVRRPNANRSSWEYTAIGRLKPGVSFDAAFADLQRVAKELEARYPGEQGPGRHDAAARRCGSPATSCGGRCGCCSGRWACCSPIACVNVTNLLLARASARARENAVRTALGATRADLVRERLTESLVYSLAGTALGWVIATWMLGVLQSVNPGGIPRLAEVTLNGWVIAFAAAAALAVGVLTGLVPAFRTPLGNILPALRHGSRGATGDRGQSRLRSVFVGAEVALSLVLLVGAGLLVRSLTHVLSVDRGFQTDRRMLVTVSIPASYGEARMRQTVDGHPRAAGIGARRAVRRGGQRPSALARQHGPRHRRRGSSRPARRAGALGHAGASSRRTTSRRWGCRCSPGATSPTRIKSGSRGAPSSASGSRTSCGPARIRSAGRRFSGRARTSSAAKSSASSATCASGGSKATRRSPCTSRPAAGATTSLQLVMHTRGEPMAAVPAVRSLVTSIDPNLPVSSIRTLEEVVTASVATRRFTMMLLVTFAGVALILALAGVYGVLAYSVVAPDVRDRRAARPRRAAPTVCCGWSSPRACVPCSSASRSASPRRSGCRV